MKIGIGIDTGGTCTDAVIYQFEQKEILAYGKTPTTKDDLSIGIGKALDQLPRDLVDQAEVIALSTTLATNACVENKGGRSKLIFFGIDPATVSRVGPEYGLETGDNLIFIDCKILPTGEVVDEPDWDEFEENLHEWLDDCDAVAVVEMFAKKSGAELEKTARDMITKEFNIPVICGHNLFSENNIVKRGATALLNARLISVIEEFLRAVKCALQQRQIKAPFVIVRSDGSLMSGDFTATRPVETLLCGPVASVMGAAELTREKNCVVVDIGGTTTDIALVKNGSPQRVKSGVRIGKWNTFVKGLFVDTFGLGGDSGVIINRNEQLELEDEKVMPLCMAASQYPSLLRHLEREANDKNHLITPQKNIYVRIKEIGERSSYSERELQLADLLSEPHSLAELKRLSGTTVMPAHLERLIREGILIRCGLTPTDVMHVKGDFVMYDVQAAKYGLSIMAKLLRMKPDDLADLVYDEFKRKLYRNIVRILIEDAYPEIRASGLGEQLEHIIDDAYTRAKKQENREFMGLQFSTPASLVGVGAPTRLFLKDVGKLLGANVETSVFSPVANALGAVVGNVSATFSMEVIYLLEEDSYMVVGNGRRIPVNDLEKAKAMADDLAREFATKDAIDRGADADTLETTVEQFENAIETAFGSIYLGYKAVATATGKLRLHSAL